MPSVLHIENLKSKTGNQAIQIADNGNIQNAPTFAAGIADTGTINAGTIGSSVAFPSTHHSGHVIQVVEFHDSTRTTVYNTADKIYDVQITTKIANSKIHVSLNTCRGTSKRDAHCAMAMGYKTGATSTNSSDYTSLHSTTAYEIEPIPNLGAFWGQESQDPNTHNSELGRYGMVPVLFNKLHEPNVPAGTTLSYSLWAAADSSRYLAIGGSGFPGTALAAGGLGTTGYDSSITLMEISSV